MNRKNIGILLILGAAVGFAGLNLFVKLSGDLPTLQKVFFRNSIAFLCSSFIILKDKSILCSIKGNYTGVFLRFTFGLLGVICNFYAVDGLADIADASLLNKLSPFFAMIFSLFILKEKVSRFEWGIVVAAFVGALFVIKPSFSLEVLPALAGFIGGMSAGLAYTLVRKLTSNGVSSSAVVFTFSGLSCLAILPFFVLQYQPMSLKQFVYLLCAGGCATIGQFCITNAYKFAPAKDISVFDYTQIIFSCVLGWIAFGTLPDAYSFVGYIIITIVAVIRWRYDLKKA